MFWLYNLMFNGELQGRLITVVTKLNNFLLSHNIDLGLTPDKLTSGTLYTIIGIAILVIFANSVLKGFSAIRAVLVAIAVIFCFYTIFAVFIYAMGGFL